MRQSHPGPRSDNTAVNFAACPAKTFLRPDGVTILGRNVPEHCQIVGEVARVLTW